MNLRKCDRPGATGSKHPGASAVLVFPWMEGNSQHLSCSRGCLQKGPVRGPAHDPPNGVIWRPFHERWRGPGLIIRRQRQGAMWISYAADRLQPRFDVGATCLIETLEK